MEVKDSFNPYTEWLGIAQVRRRPNHYVLLGLKSFESDAGAIVKAVERRRVAIMKVAAGPREALKQQVLAELTAAEQTLTSPTQRARYDELLRSESARRNSEKAAASVASPTNRDEAANLLPPEARVPLPVALGLPADPMAPLHQSDAAQPGFADRVPVADEESPIGTQPSAISPQLAYARRAARQLTNRRQIAQRRTLAAMFVLLVLIIAGLSIAYATGFIRIERGPALSKVDSHGGDEVNAVTADLSKAPTPNPAEDGSSADEAHDKTSKPGDKAQDSTKEPVGKKNSPNNPKTKRPDKTKVKESSKRPANAIVSKSRTTDDAKTSDGPPLDPAQIARFQAALVAARSSLGERDFTRAKEQVAAAQEIAASEGQKQQVTGFQSLQAYVERFWEAVQEGFKGLEKSGELQVGNTIVSVVEVNNERLVIRAAGENRRYTIDRLPPGLAVAIAKRWFDDRAENKVILGAFHFVGPRADVAEAKRLWDEAASAGVDVDPLLALLSIAKVEATESASP